MSQRAAFELGPEDWRILSALSLYRLVLVILLILLYQTGAGTHIFEVFQPERFRGISIGYALLSLLLLLLVVYRRPGVTDQAHLNFAADLIVVVLLVNSTGGVPGGLGVLLLTPAVACSLILRPRLALLLAAVATLVLFAEEAFRHVRSGHHTASDYTQAAALGLILFVTNLAASAVAVRARHSEAVAERVGSAYISLARLNERVIESMQTGVVVVEPNGVVRAVNAAARRLLGKQINAGDVVQDRLPQLAEVLGKWRLGRNDALLPFTETAYGLELLPRVSRLGWGEEAPLLILLDNAALLREQAQQLKLAALGRLSASIAHEIRNPLAAIRHAGQLLAESSRLEDEDQRLLEMIQRHTGRLDKIVRDVLDLSKGAAPQQERLQLREWLLRAVTVFREGRPQAAIQLLDVSKDLEVRFDPGHLQQVLFNLWDNSLALGEIRVLLSADRLENGRVYLEISDNGPGVAPEHVDRLFEPFFTTRSSGTGLGLFLARELCEYNRAKLQYVAQRRGACFRILFPWEPPNSSTTLSAA